MATSVKEMFEIDENGLSQRQTLSAFSGLAVLCTLLAILFASTCTASGEGAQSPDGFAAESRSLLSRPAAAPSVTFYLLYSEAQVEEIRELVELAGDHIHQIPLVITLVARTAEEEALSYARIVEHLRSGKGKPESIEVVDLRMQETE
jgi:hypothetical protein